MAVVPRNFRLLAELEKVRRGARCAGSPANLGGDIHGWRASLDAKRTQLIVSLANASRRARRASATAPAHMA